MNNFSNEQANILMDHVKFMLNTKKFNFVIYFLRTYDISDSDLSRISSYSINMKHNIFNKYIMFSDFNKLMDYVNNSFNSFADFCNNCFVIKTEESDTENSSDPFFNSMPYIKKVFENNLSSDFDYEMKNWIKNKHTVFFNFVCNKEIKNDIDVLQSRSTTYRFYTDNLTDTEQEFFTNMYKYNLLFPYSMSSSLQLEEKLSSALFYYRFNFHDFNHVIETIKNYEYNITNYLLTALEEYNIMRDGKNNMFTSALKNCVNTLLDTFTSKKIQFDTYNTDNERFKFEYRSERLQNDDEKNKAMLIKLMPEKTNKMLFNRFVCKLHFCFKYPISMQVKHTFLKNLKNYLINHNITPLAYNLIEDGKSKPATGFYMTFNCNDFESIGVNPIKFMIPKLGMKKLG